MIRFFTVSILIINIFILGCKVHKQSAIEFNLPNWHHQETLNYKIIKNGRQIGLLKFLLCFDTNNEIPIYLLYRSINYTLSSNKILDSAVVCFTRNEFLPLRSYINVSSDFGYYISEAHYFKDKVEIFHETMDGFTKKELPVTVNSYDYEMRFYLLRAADFSKRHYYQFYLVSPPINEKILYSAQISPKAKIVLENNVYECIKITLTNLYTNEQQYLYYEKNDPRRLLRYHDKLKDLRFDLMTK
ncbi:MAG: hypothetical protein NZ601_01740 [candidate division WOR-3 bacterium]|nr:hypothetical protein [candidate division WOR-3 bacterium]MCX7757004.1 hypothetical protein [candidate division WOR-3 bacterium]MDW7988339.1 hypothetical protein [candidate division WOR-3 bacterium]